MFRAALLTLALCGAAASAAAQDSALPDEALVQGALDQHPSVAAARARLAAARAEARAQRKGDQEFTFSGSYVRRSVDRFGSFDEYDAQLTRPIRLPGKGRLDREIGQFGVEAAENLAEDARHAAALLLADSWYDWLAAAARAKIDRTALANYQRALDALVRREELGDASQLDVDLARAALERARIGAQNSAGEVARARARLAAQFPQLALPADPPAIPPPSASDDELAAWRDLVVPRSHEIAAAQARARRSEALAARLRKDRIADPSVGLRLFSERNGEERGLGVVFSMPLGGSYRGAQAQRAEAEAKAAEFELRLARSSVRETAETDYADARFRIAAWRAARGSLEAQVAALEKLRRGNELGEIDLAELLLAENLAHEAFRAEADARAEAARALTRLRIDSHMLWLGD